MKLGSKIRQDKRDLGLQNNVYLKGDANHEKF